MITSHLPISDTNKLPPGTLHAAMERATLACYGWDRPDPERGFYGNDRGQLGQEILNRLLAFDLSLLSKGGHV